MWLPLTEAAAIRSNTGHVGNLLVARPPCRLGFCLRVSIRANAPSTPCSHPRQVWTEGAGPNEIRVQIFAYRKAMRATNAMIENEEESAFRQSCRRFAEQKIAPLVEEAERTGVYPLHLRQQAGEAGFLAITAPQQYGGAGAGYVFQCIAVEEFARVCAGLATGLGGLAQRLLPSIGTPDQIQRYYLPTIQGKMAGAFAMTEPDAGSDVLAMKGRARRTQNGWHIRASKMYITGAPYSDYLVVVVYTNPESRSRGVSLFIVDSKTPGVEIQKMNKLGHRSMETGMVFLDCEVPESALLGKEGDGMRNVMSVLESGRLTHAARSLGVARACYELALEQAATRKAFGQPINQFQSIHFRLSRMCIELRSAKLHVYETAARYDKGHKVHLEASMAKVVASEAAIHLADDAMQIFGGQGYIMESPIQRFFRDARLYPISEGTTEIQLRTIAKEAGIVPSL